ncbi:hypothetical protein ACFQ1E_07795 [Sphingomonas canadensis]|uniref:Uncharacterized protein n=1 Tax=Sphingomonas canadensis TaxID=1219257 RepID=A0ABW3H7V9_9SPHN|nr:hypothetical protein [Sphingomonas canadensis]MCW3835938.1 hypothetical protein [Sphingomonas canadensis]
MKPLLLTLTCLALAACVPPAGNDAQQRGTGADNAVEGANEAAAPAAEAEPAPQTAWRYAEKKDEMRGSTQRIAQVEATEPIRLPFPYGESAPVLNIRQDPKYGFDIFITANGQFLCRSWDDDTISVKFDGGAIRNWACADADGGSSDIVFIVRARPFLAELKKAKRMIVEAEMYEAGRVQMKFDVAGLDWK